MEIKKNHQICSLKKKGADKQLKINFTPSKNHLLSPLTEISQI
jgi:hypothetical protein